MNNIITGDDKERERQIKVDLKKMTIQEIVEGWPHTHHRRLYADELLNRTIPGDTIYDTIGKDYDANRNQIIKEMSKPKVITIPGTIGVDFDKWLKDGWDCANCMDALHPDGQRKALEVLNGYDEDGDPSPKPVFREFTLAQLREDPNNAARLSYFKFLRRKYEEYMRNK